jgi:beta-glucanase (GH16 family)
MTNFDSSNEQVAFSVKSSKYVTTRRFERPRIVKNRLKTGISFLFILFILFMGLNSVEKSTAQDKTDQTPTPIPSEYVPPNYRLIFGDEFADKSLNTAKWKFRYKDGHEYGAGFASYGSVTQSGDGYLHLVTRYEGSQYLTGMIRSTVQFRYGYFEARIRFQKLQGHHGAFWLQSESYGSIVGDPGRSGAEIDIIEFFGNGRISTDAKQNVYYDPYVPGQKQPGDTFEMFYRNNHGGVELSEDFHILGLLWTEDEYIFFIDGVETWRTSIGLSHIEEYIVLSLTTSEWENDRLEVNQLPDEMFVDYVQVFAQ